MFLFCTQGVGKVSVRFCPIHPFWTWTGGYRLRTCLIDSLGEFWRLAAEWLGWKWGSFQRFSCLKDFIARILLKKWIPGWVMGHVGHCSALFVWGNALLAPVLLRERWLCWRTFCVVSECVTGCHVPWAVRTHGSPWITMDGIITG